MIDSASIRWNQIRAGLETGRFSRILSTILNIILCFRCLGAVYSITTFIRDIGTLLQIRQSTPPEGGPAPVCSNGSNGFNLHPLQGCLRLRVGFKDCKDFDFTKCTKEKSDPSYNPLAANQYKHTGKCSQTLHLTP